MPDLNSPLQDALAAILNNSMGAMKAGVTFLSEQLPDVIHQLLIWQACKHGIIAAVLLISLIVSVAAWWKHRKQLMSELGPLNLFIWCGQFLLFLAGMDEVLDLVQILVAPKIFLIEYASHLVKG